MKRIIALLGSPRTEGNSETLTQAVLRGAGSKGIETSWIRLHGMTLGGCIDCRKCWSRGNPCIIVDDMNGIHDRIRQADVILFSTPLYWYTWSSQIKPVWDRFLPFLHENATWELRGKEAMLVATAGDDRSDAFEGLLFSFRTSCDLLGMKQLEPLLACGVHEKGDILKEDWVKRGEERGRAL